MKQDGGKNLSFLRCSKLVINSDANESEMRIKSREKCVKHSYSAQTQSKLLNNMASLSPHCSGSTMAIQHIVE